MKCKCKCEFLSDIDLFGKDPELYYKGKSQRTTLLGRIFTIIYAVLYSAYFIYKVVRMLKKVDISFYETYAFTGEIPSIQLNSDNFYGGFAIGGIVDETIYYPKATYYSGKRINGEMIFETKNIDLEICQLQKFGSKFRDIFKDKSLDKLYCLKNVDYILEGYSSLERYSYFYVEFYPCIGQTKDGIPCKNTQDIDNFFQANKLEFKMQDIELTPQIYDTPYTPEEKDIEGPVFKNLFQSIYAYLQIVILETDNDIIGFAGLSNTKVEKFLKYDESWIIAAPSPHINGFIPYTICDVTVQLSAKVLTQRRTNTKLTEVLGDVGGLMEVIYSFFNIIAVFITDILYEKSLIKNLFSFDLEKKMIKIKERKIKKKKSIINNNILNNNLDNNKKDNPKIYTPNLNSIKASPQSSIDEFTLHSKNILSNDYFSKKYTNDDFSLNKKKYRKKKKKNKGNSLENNSINENKNNDIIEEKIEENNINDKNNIKIFNNNEKVQEKEKEKRKETEKGKRIINKIRLNKCCIYFCFLCVRKRKILENFLLDEGMKVITKRLDILNIFKRLYKDEKIQEQMENKYEYIEMSDDFKKKLHNT